MLSSAVVIPDQDETQPLSAAPPISSPPSLKRKQSSRSPEPLKRARLDTSGAQSQQVPSSASPTSSRRRSSAAVNGAAEEKKRGQRLFGALLGTLSQTGVKSAHKKRDEIEARQRERLRKDTEEQEEQRRQKRARLDDIRRVEQKAWDEEGVRLQRRNRRAMAGFLVTKAEPKLYYRPWDLREEEEELIKRQRREVEEEIRTESLADTAAHEMAITGMDREMHDPPILGGGDRTSPTTTTNGDRTMEETKDPTSATPTQSPINGDRNGLDSIQKESSSNLSPAPQPPDYDAKMEMDEPDRPKTSDSARDGGKPGESKPKDDDNGGEELVEGQEDDVIY